MSRPPAGVLDVVVGLIEDGAGRLLVNRRQAGKPLVGEWEFPGGKRSAGEGGRAALERELAEELGIRVTSAKRWLSLRHDYAGLRVRLDVWRVEGYEGEPRALEGQRLAWHSPGDLPQIGLLAADLPIVEALLAERRDVPAARSAEGE